MTLVNLLPALLVVAAVTAVALLGFFGGHEPEQASIPTAEPERAYELERAA
jgi:hypothetical protein